MNLTYKITPCHQNTSTTCIIFIYKITTNNRTTFIISRDLLNNVCIKKMSFHVFYKKSKIFRIIKYNNTKK